MPYEETVSASLYSSYAGTNLTIWRSIVGQRINHRKFGGGKILEIVEGDTLDNTSFIMQFDKPVRYSNGEPVDTIKIHSMVFASEIVTDLSLPPDLMKKVREFEQVRKVELERIRLLEAAKKKREEERRKQKKLEAEAREEFERRKQRYQVSGCREQSPVSPLNAILIKLDTEGMLTSEDEEWLKEKRLYPVLAFHYERLGLLASAGSNWRKAQRPQRALEITEGETNNSAVLTMRGGAFRDLGELDEAEECGRRAMKITPGDYHPYNLLGAVYYQRGMPKKGEEYFQKAQELGATSGAIDGSIRSAVKGAGRDEKRKVAEYLLSKDPKRYKWAEYYLKL